jgi:hypothetical protein
MDLKMENEAHKDYICAIAEEEFTWRLKSRSLWLHAGDKKTTFFHRQAKARRWRNQITKIKTQTGEIINEFDQIKKKDTNHFSKLYFEEGNLKKELSNIFLTHTPHLITKMDNRRRGNI